MKSLIKAAIRKSPLLTTIARAVRQYRILQKPPGNTPWGFKMSGPSEMITGTFEQKETSLIRTLMDRSDVFINVGANVGFYCAHALSENKTCIAVEPHPDNVALLLRNLKINHWQAEVHAAACGDKPDVLELFGSGTAASLVEGWMGLPSVNSILVPILRLDDIVGQRFTNQRAFCLVDVEGAELGVLEGAPLLLQQEPKPLWIVEICIDEHHAGGDSRNPTLMATFDCFFNAGYRSFSVEEELREITREEIQRIAEGGPLTIQGHNFLFAVADPK